MAYELKEGQGSLFQNNKDGGNPNWPDYNGTAMINGMKLRISAWVRTPQNGGNRYLSLSIQPDNRQQGAAPEQSRQPDQQHTPPQTKQEPEGDDLPF